MMIHRGWLAVTAAALLTLPAWSAGAPITFTLNGKPVTAIPVDQLGSLTVTVNAGKPFKSLFAGQWGGIGQSLSLRGTIVDKGAAFPDTANSHRWSMTELAATALDTGWSARPTASRSMYDVATRMSLHNATTNQQVAFTVRFMRLSYTGKTIWQNGGWVKETVWETLGTPLGAATLKLEPPRSAASLDSAAMCAKAATQEEKGKMAAKDLLNEDGDYGDSKIVKVEPRAGQQPLFSWNYAGENEQLVYAKIPVNVTLHASVTGIRGELPGSAKVADFVCPMVVSAKQTVGGAWTFEDLEFGSRLRTESRTTDGRTADQIKSSMDPASMLKPDSSKSKEEQALDLIKNLGF